MKRKILGFMLIGIMCTLVNACETNNPKNAYDDNSNGVSSRSGNGRTSETDLDDEGDISISVILKTTTSEYWSYVMAGCEAYYKDYPNITVDVVGASNETAYDEQLQIIETNLASGKYDGFVIAPLEADMVLRQIAGTSYPIIAVDTTINATEILTFVGTGNEIAAYEGGKYALQMAKDAGWEELKAICISGVQGDSTVTARLTGYQEGVKEAGGEFLADETVYGDALAEKAAECMETIMKNHPDGISMILCNNDDMAIAAARVAAKNEAYAKTVFVGFDGIHSACEAILAGEETMSIAQNAFQMGYKAVEACVEAVKGNTPESFINSGSSIITKENAQEHLDNLNSYLK